MTHASTSRSQAARRSGVGIEAHELTRVFGTHRALDAISLRIEPGEAFGLLGPNGAGKTTFIRLMTGFLLPSSGSITVDGFSPATAAAEVHSVYHRGDLRPGARLEGPALITEDQTTTVVTAGWRERGSPRRWTRRWPASSWAAWRTG